MSLYNQSDISYLSNNWDDIMKKVDEQKLKVFEPSLKEMQDIKKIILDFIKSKKRKIYGGEALDYLIRNKNPEDAIYKDVNKVNDIDFYSPSPLDDLIELCNILHEQKFKDVIGQEAQHQETYSIFVNTVNYCDISFMPGNIYHKMPFVQINGYFITGPQFMVIDYFRMFTDPLISFWRIGTDKMKAIARFELLTRYYPLPSIKNESKQSIELSELTTEQEIIMKHIYNFILNKKTIMAIGLYAYNYLLYESGIHEKKNSKLYKIQPLKFFELISTNYREDCLGLIEELKSIVSINKDKITYTEFYPYFQFTGHSVEIYYDNVLMAKIYTNNKKCIPYQSVPAVDFIYNKPRQEREKGKQDMIRLGTYQVVLLYMLINMIRARTNDNEKNKQMYYSMIAVLINARNYYLESNNLSILDDTVFKDFVVYCMGDTKPPERERQEKIKQRKLKNKPYVFRYNPDDGIREATNNYVFSNSSGNPINNPKNLKLTGQIKSEYEDEDEDIDESENPNNSDNSDNISSPKTEI